MLTAARQPEQSGPRDCFLGVERSVLGKRWETRGGDDRTALALAQRFSLPELVGRVMAARCVAIETAEDFLNPTLRSLLPDPGGLADMQRAVDCLVAAIRQETPIALFGDYDVDGATSAALLARFLTAVGAPPRIYIPDRQAEGYGPNAPALRRLADEGVKVVVTLDCGTTAIEALEAAAEAGLEMVVVDHHAPGNALPPARALVNPNRVDDETPLGQLAAVGVAFLLVVALNRALRKAGWYGGEARPEPDLMAWLDLVALGTVCDVVPLTGINRALVGQGLKVMARRGNAGLAALAEVAGISEPPGTYHAAFILGPRVNAGGRVGESSLGAALLSSDDPQETRRIAAKLDAFNDERKAIEQAVLDQALLQLGEAPEDAALAFAAGEGWHPGVIGIVASRLKERSSRPALVVSLDGGIGKGSARSVPGVDLGAAVLAAREAGLLVDGGGHPMAAGLTVREADLPDLRTFLDERLAARMAEIGYRPSLGIDALLQPGAADATLVRSLQQIGPFGAGNAEPRMALASVRIAGARVVGENHVRCHLTGTDGRRLKAIAFRSLDGPLGPALLETRGLPLHIAGKLRADDWAGPDAVQLIIDDAAAAVS